LDEENKEFNSNGKRVKNDFVGFSQEQIVRAEARKNKEHNLKKKHLLDMFMNFDPILFYVDEDYKNMWIKQYNKEKVKQQYQTRKENNGNVSPPPLIKETGNFVQVNNQLNLQPSSSSSSSLPSRSSNYSTSNAMFAPLKSCILAYSLGTNLTIDLDNNNEDAIDRLLKDQNSIINAVLSQLNPKRWGGEILAHTYDPYNLLSNYNLQGYLERFRTDDKNSRNAYNVKNRLFIGRAGLGPIATRYKKLIICFETVTVYVT
jgi:hypothetical protein